MTNATIFIQSQGNATIQEAEIALPATNGDLRKLLGKLGIEHSNELDVFIDEADVALSVNDKDAIPDLKPGTRILLTRCKRIKAKVHFTDKTIDRAFAPGARVRRVKQWAVRELNINQTDAGEHVLQLCDSTTQPPTDTPLVELVKSKLCELCFDLVPEKRVEG